MFFPLRDENPLKVIRFQTVTAALIAANVLLFVYTGGLLDEAGQQRLFLSFGMVPAVVSGHAVLAKPLAVIPAALTPLTYAFLHASLLHLLGNMMFLWVFADNVEDSLGHGRFLLFYVFCGVVAALAHLLLAPASQVPLIGASGAISGVLAAYLVLFPRSKVLSLFGIIPVELPALWVLGAWLLFNLVYFIMSPTGGGVAWSAHIGGFLAGLAVTLAFRNRIRLRLARGAARRRQTDHQA